ncbi:hypothetical protein BDN70DRAFT_711886 [Pholiota conissans]|uniref:Uncharacterized protein n=1 Tax=Pholiota conissans TaxID=109636 RepID=A0A9P6CU25_9AGAR|nr:hypothetical protein BDN70DRAFT_711886 [Pholiota conissans]
MRCLAMLPIHLSLTVVVLLQSLERAAATSVPYLNPGFEFSYIIPNQTVPLPVTSQCERIYLSWSRTNNETGPAPVAPYFMQVYSSTSSVPYVIGAGFGPSKAWDVPFSPNTQFQICMFDSNGASGGCQTTYSVVPDANSTSPSCQMPPAPAALSVSATVPNGAMFQNSQINQCETLSVTPQSGSPPYTLTVAPVAHPPFNITSKTMDTISWQVALPVGFKFFLSLSSADGQMWANGPMSVGGLGGNDCFAPGTM